MPYGEFLIGQKLTWSFLRMAVYRSIWKTINCIKKKSINQKAILWLTDVSFLCPCVNSFAQGKYKCMLIQFMSQKKYPIGWILYWPSRQSNTALLLLSNFSNSAQVMHLTLFNCFWGSNKLCPTPKKFSKIIQTTGVMSNP